MDYTGGIDIEQRENGSVSIEPVAQAAQQHPSTSSEPDPQIGATTSVKAPHSSFLPTGVPPKRWLVPWLLRLLSTSGLFIPLCPPERILSVLVALITILLGRIAPPFLGPLSHHLHGLHHQTGPLMLHIMEPISLYPILGILSLPTSTYLPLLTIVHHLPSLLYY